MLYTAAEICMQADVLLIVGTSMVVYPAASLIEYTKNNIPVYVINPEKPMMRNGGNVQFITENATTGVPAAIQALKEKYL